MKIFEHFCNKYSAIEAMNAQGHVRYVYISAMQERHKNKGTVLCLYYILHVLYDIMYLFSQDSLGINFHAAVSG